MENPVTQELHKYLGKWQSDLKEQWASGAFTDQSQFGTAILNAKALGTCDACARVMEFEFNDILGEENE